MTLSYQRRCDSFQAVKYNTFSDITQFKGKGHYSYKHLCKFRRCRTSNNARAIWRKRPDQHIFFCFLLVVTHLLINITHRVITRKNSRTIAKKVMQLIRILLFLRYFFFFNHVPISAFHELVSSFCTSTLYIGN